MDDATLKAIASARLHVLDAEIDRRLSEGPAAPS
jgi:hypothetical protein